MWAVITNPAECSFVSVSDGATIGSALSNGIVIPSKAARPLEGQLKASSSGWIYRNLSLNSVREVRSGDVLEFGDVQIELIDESAHHKDYLRAVSRAWKNILNAKPHFDWNQAIDQMRRGPFQRSQLSDDIVQFLRSQFDEFSLSSPIERLLHDQEVSDVLIQAHDRIWVERLGSLSQTSYSFSTESSYRIYIENLLADQGVRWDEAEPFVDFKLKSGERVHLIGPPLAENFCLSIRKPRQSAFSLEDLRSRQMFDDQGIETLRSLIAGGKNLLIAGSTGSGKTTLLKALILAIPAHCRTLILEDTPELDLPNSNLVFLRTRIQARCEMPPVDLRQLVRQSLRMRPDRIVIGEVRGGEAMDLLHAMNTGHRGSMASLHANSCRDALFRLEGLVQMSDSRLSETVIRDIIARNVDAVVFCGKNSQGKRRVTDVSMIKGRDREQLILEVVYASKD